MATDLVRGNMQKLAAVEATQSLEVVFALAGELIFLIYPSSFPIIMGRYYNRHPWNDFA